jgi:hypothetical protein
MIGQGSTVNPNEEDLSFLMGNIQVIYETSKIVYTLIINK